MERTPGVFTRRQRPVKIQKTVHSPALTEELHVLAVDDSLVDRKVIERLLKISSCKVTTVDSGWRALQYLGLDGDKNGSVGFDGLKVNLIITDYWMPGMTGYELLKKIKESSTFKEIPVVIMSSENVQPRINRCLEEGAEEFIVKPVKLSDVKRLKDYITRDDEEEEEEEKEQGVLEEAKQVLVKQQQEEKEKGKGTNKRKLEEESVEAQVDHEKEEMNTNGNDVCVSSTTSLSTSPASSMMLSPSPTSTLSSASSSPSGSPSRRLKTSDNID